MTSNVGHGRFLVIFRGKYEIMKWPIFAGMVGFWCISLPVSQSKQQLPSFRLAISQIFPKSRIGGLANLSKIHQIWDWGTCASKMAQSGTHDAKYVMKLTFYIEELQKRVFFWLFCIMHLTESLFYIEDQMRIFPKLLYYSWQRPPYYKSEHNQHSLSLILIYYPLYKYPSIVLRVQ